MDILHVLFLLTYVTAALSAPDFPALDHIQPSASLGDQTQAVKDLIGRILGEQTSHFKVVIQAGVGPKFKDTFNILSDGGTVTITATSGVAASMGFYHYLKTRCGCQFTWAGEQLKLPNPLPVIKSPGLTVTSNDRFRYYQNVCTVSYSSVWWDWARWQREIDWMAMNGFNLPLAFTGQEAIFQKVYMSMGFTMKDLEDHFGGPAFLAWSRMGNMQGWGGPLPQSWIDNQLVLQHKILDRMRSLGMIPVLPGFAGHVPRAITRLYPNASVSQLGEWGSFNKTYCCTYLLDFHDPLFNKIGTALLKEMENEWGTDHIYNCDTFNEMDPKSSDPAYLKSAGSAVFQAMTTADPDAIWLMQGWLFQSGFWKPPQAKALLTSVPQGKMIVLDLYAELEPIYIKTDSFYGQPFIWCMLHNFGGTMELYGMIEAINKGPFFARIVGNSMIGTGLTMEGIFQNEAVYELMNENAIATAPRNLTQWFIDFPTNRYGQHNDDVVQAWQLLKIWYNPEDLFNAWGLLVKTSSSLSNSSLFRYDLVDVARNSLTVLAVKFYVEMVAAYKKKDAVMLQTAGTDLMKLMSDLDMLLASDSHFLLGTWIKDARSNGVTPEEKDLMEYNARNQVTLWGPAGGIRDYAAKQWSGLMSHFYAPRWAMFYQTLMDCVKNGTKFNQTRYNEVVFDKVEQPFTFDKSPVPSTPTGDSIQIVSDLYKAYRPVMLNEFHGQLKWWSSLGHREYVKQASAWTLQQWKADRHHTDL